MHIAQETFSKQRATAGSVNTRCEVGHNVRPQKRRPRLSALQFLQHAATPPLAEDSQHLVVTGRRRCHYGNITPILVFGLILGSFLGLRFVLVVLGNVCAAAVFAVAQL